MFSTAPDSVDVSTSGGDLTLKLPSGSYDVDTDGEAGQKTVTVETDPTSAHKVTAKSADGDVSVTS